MKTNSIQHSYSALGFSLIYSLLCLNCEGETAPAVRRVPVKMNQKLSPVGQIDFRPGVKGGSQEYYMESLAEFGLRTSYKVDLSYRQEFTSQSFDNAIESGVDFKIADGFVRLKFNELTPCFSIESRFYIPTSAASQDHEMITTIRNYLKWKQDISHTVSIGIQEIPIIHVYREPGYMGTSDPRRRPTLEANPVFENRASIGLNFGGEAISLSLPLTVYHKRYGNFDLSANHNEDWTHSVDFYPELTFVIADPITIGIAHQTGSFVREDFSGFDFGNAFRTGWTQLVLNVGL